jgi:hypothetical protein
VEIGTLRGFWAFVGGMRERAEICRTKALECERAAVLATDEANRATLLDLARQWRDMAQDAEWLESQSPPRASVR